MCAIAGIVGGNSSFSKERIRGMLASMRHRGPDYSEVRKITDQVWFGHNRLSIIDLNPASNQPFSSEDGRYTLVFNGELYNYKELRQQLQNDYSFRTQSDTEVLLNAYRKWGRDFLSKCIGMFSFALWDEPNQLLFAARDRFGVKPFYYSFDGQQFIFGSEIKALWKAGISRLRNQKIWSSFFVYGSYGLPQETFWQDVLQLPAGHYLVLQHQHLHVAPWYDFVEQIKIHQEKWNNASESAIVEAYTGLLNESIRLRFRADVPVGFTVSGGLDSSLLLALIQRAFPDQSSIHAFTFFTGHPDYDELPWVKMLLDATAYPLHAVQLDPEAVPTLAKEMASIQDEPYGGVPTLAYAELFKHARKNATIVLLDGQGMDEAWAGYDYFRSSTHQMVQGVRSSPFRPQVLMEEFRSLAESPDYPQPFQDRLLDLQYRDLFYTKLPRALRFNDRASMKYSTELREPFLDHRLVEMAFALPDRWKIQEQNGKYLLRKMAANLLPSGIRLAPKRPVQTPQREWLGVDLRDWTDSLITIFSQIDGVEKSSLYREWNDYLTTGSDNSFYIWQFINSALLAQD